MPSYRTPLLSKREHYLLCMQAISIHYLVRISASMQSFLFSFDGYFRRAIYSYMIPWPLLISYIIFETFGNCVCSCSNSFFFLSYRVQSAPVWVIGCMCLNLSEAILYGYEYKRVNYLLSRSSPCSWLLIYLASNLLKLFLRHWQATISLFVGSYGRG